MNPNDYLEDLLIHEGDVPWLYCDSRGNVTVGIGHLVATSSDAAALPMVRPDGTAASDLEKSDAWHAVKAAYDDEEPEAAGHYRTLSTIRLPVDVAESLACELLASTFLPGVAKLCPGVEGFPLPARRALVDLAYNLGVGGLARFPAMLAACNAGNWLAASEQCHRLGVNQARNDWTAQCFRDAAAEAVTPGPQT